MGVSKNEGPTIDPKLGLLLIVRAATDRKQPCPKRAVQLAGFRWGAEQGGRHDACGGRQILWVQLGTIEVVE